MEEKLGALAWSIVSDVHDQIEYEEHQQTGFYTEVIRLTALNLLIKCRFDPSFLKTNENQIFLKHLSFEGENTNLEPFRVHNEVCRILDSYSLESVEDIRRMSLNDFVCLLGQVHSIGSYALPASLKRSSKQRSLGAYYTPKRIADYISELTLSPVLQKWINDLPKDTMSIVKKFLDFHLIDPACGTGVFLVSAYELIQQHIRYARKKAEDAGLPKNQIDDYFQNFSPKLYGVDLDMGALEVTDLSLRLLDSTQDSFISQSHLNDTLRRGDSLISLEGLSGKMKHDHFFETPDCVFPLEWSKAFPEVMNRTTGGFDFIVMNPPYERLKPNIAEFIRERLLSGDSQIQMSAFEEHKNRISDASDYFRKSGEYTYATSYSLNTYQLFIERALQLARNGGSVGCIVPSTILCDVSAQNLRNALFLQNNLRVIDSFPETSRIFPGITQAVSILVFSKGGSTINFEVGFNRHTVDEALREKRLTLNTKRIVRTMGQSLMIPQIDKKGYAILEAIHQYPSLSSFPDISVNRGELDLTMHRSLYSNEETHTPLIRGSQISRLNLVEGCQKKKYVDIASLQELLSTSSRVKHIDLKRIACQQISNMNQRWRLKFAPIEPGSVLANSCNYIVYNQMKSDAMQNYLLGILNSELMNWRFQITNSNNHVSIRELQALPLVPFSHDKQLVGRVCRVVNDIRQSKMKSTSLVEACTFALYNLDSRKAKRVLEMRNCPSYEIQEVLEHFTEIY